MSRVSSERLEPEEALKRMPTSLLRANLAAVCQRKVIMDMNRVDQMIERNFQMSIGYASIEGIQSAPDL